MLGKQNNIVNLLELTPVRKYGHQINSDGLVDVLVPRFKNAIMQRFIPKNRNPFILANFDEIGTEVWLLIDGETKIDIIAKTLDKKLGEKISPVYDRLNLFFQQLHRNGFIIFKELSKGR